MKLCARCKESKPFAEFFKASRTADGYYIWCKPCARAYRRETYKGKAPLASLQEKRAHLKRKFNLTGDEYDVMVQSQNGLCAACGNPEVRIDHRNGNRMDLVVDHDHVTGKVRAILCQSCNVALGRLHDDPERVERLLRYIQRFQ